jgi:hypothetical protein
VIIHRTRVTSPRGYIERYSGEAAFVEDLLTNLPDWRSARSLLFRVDRTDEFGVQLCDYNNRRVVHVWSTFVLGPANAIEVVARSRISLDT